MFSINKKQYLLEFPGGELHNIFYKENSGICLSTFNGTWRAPSVIAPDALPDFSAVLDGSGSLHILYRSESGGLTLMTEKGGKRYSAAVHTGIQKSDHIRAPGLLATDDKIYILYVLELLGKKTLFCQSYEAGKDVAGPRALDRIKGGTVPYRSAKTEDGRIHVFYRSPGGSYGRPGYRTLDTGREEWGEFIPISMDPEDSDSSYCEILSVAADGHHSLHALLQKLSGQKCELVHMRLPGGPERLKKTLSSSPFSFGNSAILVLNDKLIVYWVRENKIFWSRSQDGGNSWTKPERYDFIDGPLACFQLLSAPAGRGGSAYLNELPGSFSENCRLAFIDELGYEKEESELMNNYKDSIIGTLKMLSRSIDELNKSINEINDKIKSLEAGSKLLSIEASNQSAKMNLAEAEFSRTREEFKKIRNEFYELKKAGPTGKESNAFRTAAVIEADDGTPGSAAASKKSVPLMPGTGFAHITPELLMGEREE